MKRNKQGKSRKNRRAKQTIDLAGPLPMVMSYAGPVHENPPRPIIERSVQVLNYDAIVQATAGGQYAFSVGAGSSTGSINLIANALEWSAFAGQFSDYRVLGLRLQFCPSLQDAVLSGSATAAPWYTATDIDDATAPTVYGDLQSFNTLRMVPQNRPWFREVSLIGRSGEGDLQPVGSAFTKYQSIKCIILGVPATAILGRLHVWWRVQFYHRE
jgi:hypothetical protein